MRGRRKVDKGKGRRVHGKEDITEKRIGEGRIHKEGRTEHGISMKVPIALTRNNA